MKRLAILALLLLLLPCAVCATDYRYGMVNVGGTCPTHQWDAALSPLGVVTCTQPASTDLSDFSTTPGTDNQVPLNISGTYTPTTLPACADSGGNHLNYASHAFTCGTSLAATGATNTVIVANENATGTTVNKLATYSTQSNPTAILATTTSDGPFIGIVTSGAGTTGFATIQTSGTVSCVFDGATTSGDAVVASVTTAGDCHDAGSATPSTLFEVLGTVNSTNGGAGTYAISLQTPWPATLGGFQVCDKTTLNANQFHLLFFSNGSGINTLCNNQSSPSILGTYNWGGQMGIGAVSATGDSLKLLQGGAHIAGTNAGAPPGLGTCVGGTINTHSLDSWGRVTGTTGATCAITFSTAFTGQAPICRAQDETTATTLSVTSVSTAGFTVGGIPSGDAFNYVCFGMD